MCDVIAQTDKIYRFIQQFRQAPSVCEFKDRKFCANTILCEHKNRQRGKTLSTDYSTFYFGVRAVSVPKLVEDVNLL